MIDEWFDRSYQEGRIEFHAGISSLMEGVHRFLTKNLRWPAKADIPQRPKELSCDAEPPALCQSRSS